MALVDVRRAYFYAPSRRRVLVELPPKDYQACADCCGTALYGTSDAAHNCEEELAATFSKLELTRGIACRCVWQGRISGEDVVATVHRGDSTIGGHGQPVEHPINMISGTYETKKQL